jgi:hypothetical protein
MSHPQNRTACRVWYRYLRRRTRPAHKCSHAPRQQHGSPRDSSASLTTGGVALRFGDNRPPSPYSEPVPSTPLLGLYVSFLVCYVSVFVEAVMSDNQWTVKTEGGKIFYISLRGGYYYITVPSWMPFTASVDYADSFEESIGIIQHEAGENVESIE